MASSDYTQLQDLFLKWLPTWEPSVERGSLVLYNPKGGFVVFYVNQRTWGLWSTEAEGWPQWSYHKIPYKGRGWRERMVADAFAAITVASAAEALAAIAAATL